MSRLRLALAAALATAAAMPVLAQTPRPNGTLPGGQCFYSRDWRGWASPSPDVLYIRVRQKDVYRIDLAPGGTNLNAPLMRLVSITRASDRVCGPIDLDLRATDGIVGPIPLFPKAIVKLTEAEAKALPKNARP